MKQIPLTQGKFAIVDDEDFERVNQFKWYAHKNCNTYYADRSVNDNLSSVSMHRFILDTPTDMQTDHINGDGLDNRRANLRICTHAENQRNRSRQSINTVGFKGVYPDRAGRVRALIMRDGKQIYLGSFLDPISAAHAYDSAAQKYHGDFAQLNFTEGKQT